MNATELARHIEHAVLAPQATDDDLAAGVRVALGWGVRALVVKPCHVAAAARQLARSGVKTVAVVGFPHGGQTATTKVAETRQAVVSGADEIDMVINIGALRGRQTGAVFYEILSVVEAAQGRPVKVIIETAFLTDAEKRLACRLAARAGAASRPTSMRWRCCGPAPTCWARATRRPSCGTRPPSPPDARLAPQPARVLTVRRHFRRV